MGLLTAAGVSVGRNVRAILLGDVTTAREVLEWIPQHNRNISPGAFVTKLEQDLSVGRRFGSANALSTLCQSGGLEVRPLETGALLQSVQIARAATDVSQPAALMPARAQIAAIEGPLSGPHFVAL